MIPLDLGSAPTVHGLPTGAPAYGWRMVRLEVRWPEFFGTAPPLDRTLAWEALFELTPAPAARVRAASLSYGRDIAAYPGGLGSFATLAVGAGPRSSRLLGV